MEKLTDSFIPYEEFAQQILLRLLRRVSDDWNSQGIRLALREEIEALERPDDTTI